MEGPAEPRPRTESHLPRGGRVRPRDRQTGSGGAARPPEEAQQGGHHGQQRIADRARLVPHRSRLPVRRHPQVQRRGAQHLRRAVRTQRGMRFHPVRRAGRTPGQIRDDRDPGTVLHSAGNNRPSARIRLQRRPPCLHHALLRNRRRGDRMARPRAAQPHRRVRHDLQPIHPPERPRIRGIRRNARQNPGKRRAGAHRTGHPIRRHRRARQLRPLRVEGLRRGDPTWLRQGRRRMDRHPARRRHHPRRPA